MQRSAHLLDWHAYDKSVLKEFTDLVGTGTPSCEVENQRINEKYNSDSYDNLRGRLDHLDVQMQDELNKLEKLRQYWIDNAIAESKSKP